MKKIFILIAIFLFITSFALAGDEYGDCDIVLLKENIISHWGNNEGTTNISLIMSKEDMEMSFDNLKSYCCDLKKITGEFCDIYNRDYFYPKSIYLFDHVFDVYLRKIDAKQENENGENLLYGLSPDLSGKERREFITDQGNRVEGSLPVNIQSKYNLYWKLTQNIPAFLDSDEQTINNWKQSVNLSISQYSMWTLYDKYNLACDISNYILKYFIKSNNSLSASEYKACKNLTSNRIKNENTYVQAILLQKSNVLLDSNMKGYLNNYFVRNKLSSFEEILMDITTSFMEINKAISRLVEKCS